MFVCIFRVKQMSAAYTNTQTNCLEISSLYTYVCKYVCMQASRATHLEFCAGRNLQQGTDMACLHSAIYKHGPTHTNIFLYTNACMNLFIYHYLRTCAHTLHFSHETRRSVVLVSARTSTLSLPFPQFILYISTYAAASSLSP